MFQTATAFNSRLSTGDHIGRVQLLSEELARAAGLDAEAASNIGWSAMLHDVGKLHVPDRILLKPGPLNAEEWEIMRQHPLFGEQILREGTGFEMARRIARWHHENLDGSGYPDGLKGSSIPLEVRIVRVTDALDAVTNVRPTSRRGVSSGPSRSSLATPGRSSTLSSCAYSWSWCAATRPC